MMQLNSYRFEEGNVLKRTIRVKTETPGAKEGVKALNNLKKAAVDASTTGFGVGVDFKSLDSGITKIEKMKNLVTALKNTNVNFSKLKNSLDTKGLTNVLPTGVKGTLSDFSTIQAPMKNARWGDNRYQKDIQLLSWVQLLELLIFQKTL